MLSTGQRQTEQAGEGRKGGRGSGQYKVESMTVARAHQSTAPPPLPSELIGTHKNASSVSQPWGALSTPSHSPRLSMLSLLLSFC